VFVHEAELSGRCNSSERKGPYSRVLYLVLFDTSFESECNFVFKILNKNYIFGRSGAREKNKIQN
jgi:hypothetical protein